jgi:fumarate reductase flavoprotein subunit
MKRREFLIAGSAAMLMPSAVFAQQVRDRVDVLVIGAGGAGLSAAIVAKDAGANVLVLEKMPVIGGNTQLAAGGMNVAGSKLQAEKGITDTWQSMYDDTIKGGGGTNQKELVEILCRESNAAAEWLMGLGAVLPSLVLFGGMSKHRALQPTGAVNFGPYITKVLFDNANKRSIPIRTNSAVIDIVQKPDGSIRGALVQDRRTGMYIVEAKAIVLASGGYSASGEKVGRFKPEYAKFSSTNQPGATGDVLDFSERLGIDFVDLDQIQIHPTQAVGAKTLITETVRGVGAIMVNRDGKRFVNEMTTRDKGSAAVLEQKGQTAFLVFDQSIRDSMKLIEGYFHLDLVKEGKTLPELAAKFGAPGDTLVATLDSYNKAVSAKKDAEFGREDLPRQLVKAPFYAIEVRPGNHFTMGGVRIDTKAQVMSKQKQPIRGLYAAGEVTGGIHGQNRIGGNSMTTLFTFGPIAGREAAAFAKV